MSYQQQAIDFLKESNTKLDIKYLHTGKHFHDDTEERDIYLFTLTNDKFSYSANFGDSIRNTEKRKIAKNYKPNEYDVLSCLDVLHVDSFEEFCFEFGYDDLPLSEHDNVMRIFLKCREQSNALKKLFTNDQLEQLQEIN